MLACFTRKRGIPFFSLFRYVLSCFFLVHENLLSPSQLKSSAVPIPFLASLGQETLASLLID